MNQFASLWYQSFKVWLMLDVLNEIYSRQASIIVYRAKWIIAGEICLSVRQRDPFSIHAHLSAVGSILQRLRN